MTKDKHILEPKKRKWTYWKNIGSGIILCLSKSASRSSLEGKYLVAGCIHRGRDSDARFSRPSTFRPVSVSLALIALEDM